MLGLACSTWLQRALCSDVNRCLTEKVTGSTNPSTYAENLLQALQLQPLAPQGRVGEPQRAVSPKSCVAPTKTLNLLGPPPFRQWRKQEARILYLKDPQVAEGSGTQSVLSRLAPLSPDRKSWLEMPTGSSTWALQELKAAESLAKTQVFSIIIYFLVVFLSSVHSSSHRGREVPYLIPRSF